MDSIPWPVLPRSGHTTSAACEQIQSKDPNARAGLDIARRSASCGGRGKRGKRESGRRTEQRAAVA